MGLLDRGDNGTEMRSGTFSIRDLDGETGLKSTVTEALDVEVSCADNFAAPGLAKIFPVSEISCTMRASQIDSTKASFLSDFETRAAAGLGATSRMLVESSEVGSASFSSLATSSGTFCLARTVVLMTAL